MSYAEQLYEDFGRFICKSCHTTFPKADPLHGSSGFCSQCEIALGLVKIHATEEENRLEQLRTRAVIGKYNQAFNNPPMP